VPNRLAASPNVRRCASVVRRSLASGVTAILFALGPLGAGLAIANDQQPPAASSDTAASRSKQHYIDRVDRICVAGSAEMNNVFDLVFPGAPYGNLPPDDRDMWVVKRVVPIIRAEIAAAREVPPPHGDEAAVKAIFDAKERAVETLERYPAAIRVFAYGTPDDPFALAADMAGDYGFSICALGSPEVD
jgi:hypothetical protein